MNYTKFIGWILFAVGLIIIFYSILASYNIFTGKSPVPLIFKIKEGEATFQQGVTTPEGKSPSEIILEEKLREQLRTLIPVDYLPKLFNLIAWSIFASILIFAGARLSDLGIKLLKDKKKKLNEN